MEGVKLIFALCCLGYIAADKEEQSPVPYSLADLYANIEMSVTAEQIALMSLTNVIKRNQHDIKKLKEQIENIHPEENPKTKHEEKDVPQKETVQMIESDEDFDKKDADGNKFKKVKVMFKKAYKHAPKVLASIQRIDSSKDSLEFKFEIRVEDVTTKDFILVVMKRGNETVIDHAAISYLSVPSM